MFHIKNSDVYLSTSKVHEYVVHTHITRGYLGTIPNISYGHHENIVYNPMEKTDLAN